MNVTAKYFLFLLGFFASAIAIWNNHLPASIVSIGSFIAYALMETQGQKIIKSKEEKD